MLLVVLLIVGIVNSCALEESEIVEIQPCSVTTAVVSSNNSITYVLIANFSLCNDSSSQALRLSTWSSDSLDSNTPLVFVTRQGKSVNSWTIPFQPPDFSIGFNRVNHTLCDHEAGEGERIAYLNVFTSNQETVSFNIVFDPIPNYYFEMKTQYSLQVGASTPQVYVFQFPPGVTAVSVQANARSKRCAILSVQNVSCPVNDLLEEIKSRGHYQTMSTDGFVTVTKDLFEGDSFFIVLITTNFSECHSHNYAPQYPLIVNGTVLGFDQQIDVVVHPLESAPVLPIIFPLLIFGAFYLITFIVILFEKQLKCLWSPPFKWKLMKKPPSTTAESNTLIDGTRKLRTTYGTSSSTSQGDELSSASPEDSLELSVMEQKEKDLTLPRMCKLGEKSLRSQYSVYSWNTITVGIFYGLPAFQLVLSQQLLATSSGEEDMCYYNFKCSHPVGVLSAFNSVWSNIGYFLLGFLFIIITFIRKTRYTYIKKHHKPYYDIRGIPQFYGLYYAMGVALIFEGLMSSFYHICPTNANFQFDTAFMFIIAGLILTKIFQQRHPDINVNAFVAFFSFAVVIFFTLIGIHYDRENPVAVRCSLLLIIIVMVSGFFISFYYFHRWKLSKQMFVKVFKSWNFFSLRFLHPVRFIKLLLIFLVNIVVAIVAVAASSYLDFATTILTLFLTNVALFLLFYVITKLCYREPWTLLPMVLPILVLGLWVTALYYFLRYLTNWQLTPAESRNLNRPCSLMRFYDDHDIWHFLSACALFCSFLFIMTLDDGIEDWRLEDIHVF